MIRDKDYFYKMILLFWLILLLNGLFISSLSNKCNMVNSLKENWQLKTSNSNIWTRIWDVGGSIGAEVITDSSYNVYIAGLINKYPWNIIFNIKYDKYGFEQWNSIWTLDEECHIMDFGIDSLSNIYNLVTFPYSNIGSVLMKINNSGFSEWNKTIEGTTKGIYIDKFDNIYILGDIRNSTKETRIFTKKIDQNGNSIWNNSFLIDGYAEECTVMVDHLNQTYTGGLIYSSGFPDGSPSQSFDSYITAPYAYISIHNSSGALISFKEWRISEYYITPSMVFDYSFNLYLMGADKSLSNNTLLKYNSSGNLLFSTNWHNNAIEFYEFWTHIAQDSLNNTYCAGINYFWDGMHIYLVKFSNQGYFEWDGKIDSYNKAAIGDLYIDSNFSIYITGRNDGKMVIFKNPSLSTIFDPPNTISIEFFIALSSIYSIWILIGIFFYVKMIRKYYY